MIFGAVAQNYWDAGLPVIPLKVNEKRPFGLGWQRHAEVMPTPEEQAIWLERYAINNIGLPLGPQSRVAAFDVDTDDPVLLALFEKLLPNSPWTRKGKKGYVIAVRYNPKIPTFRIKDLSGKTLVEYLSKGTQIVLPPSIHPDTLKPYTSNTNLWEVLNSLPEVNEEIEALLRGALKDEKIVLSHSGSSKMIEWVPQGARDVKMVELAGLYAYAVTRGERTLLEAIGMLHAWADNYVEHVAGDDLDINKGVQRLIQFLCKDVLQNGKSLPQGWDTGLSDDDKAQLGLTFTEDNLEWDSNQVRDYLRDEFEKHERGSGGRMTAVEYALSKLALSRNMSMLEKEQLIRYMVDVSGMNLTVSVLRKRMLELAKGPVEGLNHTEIAKAVREHIEEVSPLKFWAGEFRKWNGSHWEVLDKARIFNIIADNYGSLQMARRNSDHTGIFHTLGHLVTGKLAEFPVKGINFANGLLLENGEMVPHDPKYGMVYTLGFRYLPEEAHKATRFFEFLRQSWGQDADYEDKVKALQEALCATVFGLGTKYQRAVLLLGPPRTGKSQLLEILQSLVPDEARCAVPPEDWSDKFAPAEMYGKMLNFCGELSEKKAIDGRRFKEIVDGSPMTGQHKHGSLFDFRPTPTHWFGSNHTPKTTDSSAAFSRRWLILKFNRQVPTSAIVRNLGEEIAMSEREAIMAWAVEALPRLVAQAEYTLPASHKMEVADMSIANNSVRFFLLESGKVRLGSPTGEGTTNPISESALHTAYSFTCRVGEVAKPVGLPRFRSMMKELAVEFGFKPVEMMEKGQRVQGYSGLTFVDAKAA